MFTEPGATYEDDLRLAEGLREQRPGAVGHVYNVYGPQLIAYAGELLGGPEHAAEAVRAALLALRGGPVEVPDPAELRNRLFAMVRDECAARVAPAPAPAAVPPPPAPPPAPRPRRAAPRHAPRRVGKVGRKTGAFALAGLLAAAAVLVAAAVLWPDGGSTVRKEAPVAGGVTGSPPVPASSDAPTPSGGPSGEPTTSTSVPPSPSASPSASPSPSKSPSKPAAPKKKPSRGGPATLSVTGNGCQGVGVAGIPTGCSITVRASGGAVDWSVASTSATVGRVTASGRGHLAAGQSATARVTIWPTVGCYIAGRGTGGVAFSPGASAAVTFSCRRR
ncbi:hypothetical protein [Actinomadura parmotrematis]|uniref:Ig-like domain-containing protein n=1 Tax=Actinomadura parmotrematis TaxID=2864039 RepID=A0ABS7FPP6_9ACTN|nr:hypothetical protein [Actinomadura parmotrematis]MBW8482357.1 hypothetical protein [Actinomadura parmotrematis]